MRVPKTYSVAIVTFKRPESLGHVLGRLSEQTHPPDVVVVADNDFRSGAVERVLRACRGTHVRIEHLEMPGNVGASGGWRAGIERLSRDPHRGEFVLLIDDDDPIESIVLMEQVLADPELADGNVAALGLRGARLDRGRARLIRCIPATGQCADVDYLAGGGLTVYRWAAIDTVGPMMGDLFFGFEDLEWGLRMKRAGLRLVTRPRPELQSVADTSPARDAWREYYKIRALVWVLAHHVGVRSATVASARSLGTGLVRSLMTRSPDLLLARARGLNDGWRGRLGPVDRYLPKVNPAKATGTDARGELE